MKEAWGSGGARKAPAVPTGGWDSSRQGPPSGAAATPYTAAAASACCIPPAMNAIAAAKWIIVVLDICSSSVKIPCSPAPAAEA